MITAIVIVMFLAATVICAHFRIDKLSVKVTELTRIVERLIDIEEKKSNASPPDTIT